MLLDCKVHQAASGTLTNAPAKHSSHPCIFHREKALLLGRIRDRSWRAPITGSSTAALLFPLASKAEPTSYSTASNNRSPGEEEEDSVFKFHIFQFSLMPHISPNETEGDKSSNPDTKICSVQTLDSGLDDTGASVWSRRCSMEDGIIQEDDSALYTTVSNMARHIPRTGSQETRCPPKHPSC